MKAKYTLGDWSNDGHNVSEVFYLSFEGDTEKLAVANKQVAELLGRIGGFQSICKEYEDSYLPACVLAKLDGLGINLEALAGYGETDDDTCYVSGEELIGLWVQCMNIADHTLKLELIDGGVELCYSLGSMGYGCYGNY